MMDYQIVELKEKKIAGFCAKTSNSDPEMGRTIGGLWQRLFGEEGIAAIPDQQGGGHTIGLYSDYENGVQGRYDITAGCEISGTANLPERFTVKTIPAGRYAEFVIQGDSPAVVGAVWAEIWKLPLDRAFTGDFEEYAPPVAGKPMEIHVYIALK